jgi:hypothetical protein
MKTKQYPYWIVSTNRTWKAQKRREWKAVVRAADTYRIGCAYTPDHQEELAEVYRLLPIITAKLGAKEWGR